MTAPNLEPLIKLVRRFGADVARLARQLAADIAAHFRDADPEVVIERVLLAVAGLGGRLWVLAARARGRRRQRPAAA